MIADGGVVDSGNIEEIYQDGLWLIPAKKEDIYTCPQCGEIGSVCWEIRRRRYMGRI